MPPNKTKYIKTKALVEQRHGSSRGVIHSRSMASHIRSGVAQAGRGYAPGGQAGQQGGSEQTGAAIAMGYAQDTGYLALKTAGAVTAKPREVIRDASGKMVHNATAYAGEKIKNAAWQGANHISQTQGGMRFMQSTEHAGQAFKPHIQRAGKVARFTGKAAKTVGRVGTPVVKATGSAVNTTQAIYSSTDYSNQAGAVAMEATIKAGGTKAARFVLGKTENAVYTKAVKPIAKFIGRVLIGTVKAAARGAMALLASSPVLLIVAFMAVVVIVASPFGIFMGDSAQATADGQIGLVEIATRIDAQLQERVDEISRTVEHDALVINYAGSPTNTRVNNWPDILAVFSTKTTMDDNDPMDVVELDEVKQELLNRVWHDMTEIDYYTVEHTYTDDDGDEHTTITLYITITAKFRDEMYPIYKFNRDKQEITEELMAQEEFVELAKAVGTACISALYSTLDGLELPPGSELYQIVQLLMSRLGDPYSQSQRGQGDYVDCSYLVQWAYQQLGISLPGTAAEQARYAANHGYTTSSFNLQPGDLVFWSLKSSDGEWTQPDRYMHVSHVGVYIGGGMVIDASSKEGEVVMRSLWGSPTMYAHIPS